MKKVNKILLIVSIVVTVFAFIMNRVEVGKQNRIANCSHNWQLQNQDIQLCTYTGDLTYKCNICNKTKTEPNNATGHDYGYYYSRWNGGCTTHTYNVYNCIHCDHEKITITDGNRISNHIDATENQYCYSCGFTCREVDLYGNVLMFSNSFGYVAEFYNTIADWNFSHSKDELRAIYFSYSVETIASGAFANATDLLCVDIPSTVTTIGENAFDGCTNIRRARVPSTTSGAEQFANESSHIFKIDYELNGGTNDEDNPVVYSSLEIITLEVPTKDGFTFVGWTTPESNVPVYSRVIPSGSTGNLTFIANWQSNSSETPGETPETPETPGETPETPGETPETPSDPTVPTYSITYYLNEGTNHVDNPSFYTGETAVVLKAPKRPGFTFAGWLGSGLSTPTIDVTIEAGSTGEKYYIATWEEVESYSITYNLNGGTNHANNPASFKLDDNSITLQNPTRGGYDFVGWFKDSSFVNKITTIETSSATANIELFAKWEALFTLSGNTITGLTEYGQTANIKHLVIPGSIDGTAIYQVGYKAFDNEGFYSVVFEEGVRKISSQAFHYCRYLTSIKLPSSLTSIGDSAFSNCVALAEVYNLSLLDFENNNYGDIIYYAIAFKTDWQQPSSIEEIDGVFYYIENETSYVAVGAVDRNSTKLTLHEKTTKIKKYAFDYMEYLEEIDIPETVKSIGSYAFSDCVNLLTINLPSSLEEIGDYAFEYCNDLSQIVIPSSVTTIGGYAFYGSYNLIIYAEGSEESVGWHGDWNPSDCLVFWFSESQPTSPGNWWHYVNGQIVVW